MKKIILVLIFFLLAPATSVSAHNRGLVLGKQTTAPLVPLSAGPGFLLPDSPFYFLDDWLDQVRLFLTFDPKARANLRMRLAAEKLAELGVLLAERSPRGIEVALNNLTAHIDKARQIMEKEKAKGKDVSGLAHDLNEAIDQEQEFLDSLLEIARPQDRFLFKNAQVKIAEDEIEIEDELGEEERENELMEELAEGAQEEIEEASQAAKRAIELNRELQEKIIETKKKQLENQAEVLKEALEKQGESMQRANEEAKKLQEKLQEQTRSGREEQEKGFKEERH